MLFEAKSSPEYLFQKKTGLKLGKLIKDGNGKIYNLKDYTNRVVKIDDTLDDEGRKHVMKIIRFLKKSKNPVVVKIYQAGILDDYYHYYVMDKLKPLKIKLGESDLIYKHINVECKVPKRGSSKLKSFIKGAINLNRRYYYADLHDGNIMLTKNKSYKLIDLESFTY